MVSCIAQPRRIWHGDFCIKSITYIGRTAHLSQGLRSHHRGLCMLQQSAQALCPLSRDSAKPGIPRAWPSALPNQVFFPWRASCSLWGVWRSRGMKANEVKYNHSTPSHSKAAQSRLWEWAVICLPNWLELAHLSPTEKLMI